jgi:ParB family chromosome partitioning protein
MVMELQNVGLSKIKGPAFNIRTETRAEDPELLASIKTHGLKQPILLRPSKTGYQIVAGIRRYQACKKLGLKSIPAVVEKLDDKTAFEIMLAENIQRRQLSPIEEARAFREYLDKYKESIRTLAKRINKSHVYIVEKLFLIDWMNELPPKAREEVKQEMGGGSRVTASHLQELTKIREPETIRKMVSAIKDEKLTRDQTAQAVSFIQEQELPVEKAVQAVKVIESAREAAASVTEAVRDAVMVAGKEISDIESSPRRKLMEGYVLLGTIVKALDDNKLYCLKHKEKELMWKGCGTTIRETQKQFAKELGIG